MKTRFPFLKRWANRGGSKTAASCKTQNQRAVTGSEIFGVLVHNHFIYLRVPNGEALAHMNEASMYVFKSFATNPSALKHREATMALMQTSPYRVIYSHRYAFSVGPRIVSSI